MPASYQRLTFSLDEYREQTVYIGFRNVSVDKSYLLVDDVFLRQVPLPSTGILREEFEEGLVPPGWITTNNLWNGGTPSDAGVPDNGTRNIFYFQSSDPSGSTGELTSPRCKRDVTSGFISYRFNYYNYDGNDSLQIYYKIDDGGWILHKTVYTTPSGWQAVTGGPIYLTKGKSVHYIQFKFVGYADGGSSFMAVDNFEAYDGSILNLGDVAKPQFFVLSQGRDIVLKATGINGEIGIEIFDVSGRRSYVSTLTNGGELRISGLRGGIYFVRFSGEIKGVKKILLTY